MAISLEQWQAMVPGETKIKDHAGFQWSVLRFVTNHPFTKFILDRDGDNHPMAYQFITEGPSEGIVAEEIGWDVDLNHENTDIVV